MEQKPASVSRVTRARFSRAVREFAISEVGGKARVLFAALMGLLLGINGLNVVSSYVGRNFMTAIAHRDISEFRLQVVLYLVVFAVCTVVAVFQRYTEERLGLLWRAWLTHRLVGIYLEHPIYYRLTDHVLENGEIANPDQRIAEDVRVFTTTTLSFVLMVLNGVLTVVAFSGVLWSISPSLFVVAVAYAAIGSVVTVALGSRLIGLNSRQLDQEADFRTELINLRENSESIALLRHEARLEERILRPLGALTMNLLKIIAVNRNLGFFTTGYNYLIQIIPALVVAPLFIHGDVEFGVITQSAMAFSALLGAFSLIITQFQSISSFAAVISRLGALAEAAEQAQSASASAIEIRHSPDWIEYANLSLASRGDGSYLVRDLTLTVARGTRLLVLGPDDAKISLFRATAGIWDSGSGTIVCPDAPSIFFLPEKPYLPPGTLREFMVPASRNTMLATDAIAGALKAVGAEAIVEQSGGLDVERHWDDLLSLGEQQLLGFARVVLASPVFAILDRVGTALTTARVELLLAVLDEHSISYVHFAETEADATREHYDAVLELAGDGSWTCTHTGADSGLKPIA